MSNSTGVTLPVAAISTVRVTCNLDIHMHKLKPNQPSYAYRYMHKPGPHQPSLHLHITPLRHSSLLMSQSHLSNAALASALKCLCSETLSPPTGMRALSSHAQPHRTTLRTMPQSRNRPLSNTSEMLRTRSNSKRAS